MKGSFKPRFFVIGMSLLVAILFSYFGCAKEKEEEILPPADLVLFNGDIYTVNPDNPEARALVITGNLITAILGRDEED